jgi:hypothetical protein
VITPKTYRGGAKLSGLSRPFEVSKQAQHPAFLSAAATNGQQPNLAGATPKTGKLQGLHSSFEQGWQVSSYSSNLNEIGLAERVIISWKFQPIITTHGVIFVIANSYRS